MKQLVVVVLYMVKPVKIDWLKLIIEDFDNLLLGKIYKAKGKTLNLLGDLTCDIIFFF